MRFLKKKLARAQELFLLNEKNQSESIKQEESSPTTIKQEFSPISPIEQVIKIETNVLTELSEFSPKPLRKKASPKANSKLQSPQSDRPLRGATSAKNIIKNYGRALANFAASDLASSYLTKLAEQEKIKEKEFRKYISSKKKQARCIKGLRDLLLITEDDSQMTVAYKKIFRELSIIFMKFFSVNWIFGGKLCDKKIHLKYRFKILRRIQNPEFFTYLKGFA